MVEKSQGTGFWPSLYEPFRLAGSRLADWLAPAAEASRDDTGYHISMELPGVAEDDIHLTVEDGMVQVSGEKKTSREEKGETWYFSERQFGSFSRSFRLPADADAAGVTAEMKDGVLTVTIPKRTAAPAAKRVPITKAASQATK
jgi:HSP20 family protein